jgi:hypothetical protein
MSQKELAFLIKFSPANLFEFFDNAYEIDES